MLKKIKIILFWLFTSHLLYLYLFSRWIYFHRFCGRYIFPKIDTCEHEFIQLPSFVIISTQFIQLPYKSLLEIPWNKVISNTKFVIISTHEKKYMYGYYKGFKFCSGLKWYLEVYSKNYVWKSNNVLLLKFCLIYHL